jgi:ABC-type transporter Mla subunit MlaD
MPTLSVASTVAVVAALLIAAGCGGGDDTSAAEQWASSACSAVNTWTSSIESIGETVKQEPTRAGVEKALDDLESSTQTLVDDLKGLGAPETEAGQEAEDAINALADDLDQSLEEIKGATDNASGASGVLSAISVVTANLSTMADDASSTIDELQQLDGGQELKDAFDNAESCADLRSTGS